MNDFISRQAAIDAIKTWGLLDGLSEGQAIEILADAEKLPSTQPEVTEEAVKDYCRKRCLTILTNDCFYKLTSAQPEIIHCKDCMYSEQDADGGCPLERPGWHRTDDDFCSRAERREE